jgi:hypothetical protein
MEKIKFVIGGRTGDLFHCLYVVKNTCELFKTKAELYITNDFRYGGDSFLLPIEKTFEDLHPLITKQSYISSFSILNKDIQKFVNLNIWRPTIGIHRNWITMLCDVYGLPKSGKNWITSENYDKFKNKIVIHRSTRRHSLNFPWEKIVNNNDCIFLTSDINEYNSFQYKDKVQLHLWKNFLELANIINSSKIFIGNQSTPLALAHGLGSPRLAELNRTDQRFYIGEEKVLPNYYYFSDNLPGHIVGLDKFIKL